eukprot:1179530-Prorocentrum_minimum.AAC.5
MYVLARDALASTALSTRRHAMREDAWAACIRPQLNIDTLTCREVRHPLRGVHVPPPPCSPRQRSNVLSVGAVYTAAEPHLTTRLFY